jgi:radical SAM superfamily enzyme YgiQ (UPF0313 family)
MQKRIVLVKPPECSIFNFGTFSLGVLAAAVRHLAEVKIIDVTDLSASSAAEAVWSHEPDLIGVTVMGLASVQSCADLLRQLRATGKNVGRRSSSTKFIAGGHGASMLPRLLLEAGADAVVIGEGEMTLSKLLMEGIRPGAPGLACLSEGRVVIGPPQKLISPLDALAPPARELMPPPPDGVHLMETSRGCPHTCTFCETTRFYGKRWRGLSPHRVVKEVRRLVAEYDAWIIHIADDNFTASLPRVFNICEALQKEQFLPAFFMASARGDDLLADPNLLPTLAAARILRLTVGVESLDLPTTSGVGKHIPLETYQEVFKRMRELGMFSVASFIIGLPGEDPQARERSVQMAIEAEPDAAHFLPFQPLPGTPLAAEHGRIDPDPEDVHDANKFTQTFFAHPTIRARLQAAGAQDGIRGILARGALEKHSQTVAAIVIRNRSR